MSNCNRTGSAPEGGQGIPSSPQASSSGRSDREKETSDSTENTITQVIETDDVRAISASVENVGENVEAEGYVDDQESYYWV